MERELLVVGEAFDDLVFHDLPRLPSLGEELKTEAFHHTVGGGVLITATAAHRLGTATRVLSALSERGEEHLSREGIPFRNLRRPGEEAALTVVLSTPGERAFVTFEGVNRFLEDRLLELLPTERARHLHAALAPRRVAAWVELIEELRGNGTTVSWDFGWNPSLAGDRDALLELVAALDVLFLNEAEATLYSGCDDPGAALMFLGGRAQLTLVKRGPAGCAWSDGASRGDCPPREVEAVDTTGAGDAFDGAYLHAWLRGLPLDGRLRLANDVGALSTRRPGGVDGLPRRGELP